jgi:hypothetical protein
MYVPRIFIMPYLFSNISKSDIMVGLGRCLF